MPEIYICIFYLFFRFLHFDLSSETIPFDSRLSIGLLYCQIRRSLEFPQPSSASEIRVAFRSRAIDAAWLWVKHGEATEKLSKLRGPFRDKYGTSKSTSSSVCCRFRSVSSFLMARHWIREKLPRNRAFSPLCPPIDIAEQDTRVTLTSYGAKLTIVWPQRNEESSRTSGDNFQKFRCLSSPSRGVDRRHRRETGRDFPSANPRLFHRVREQTGIVFPRS